ncbi:hypothetical protein QWE_00035 [Agrobacterium albertimagni AOL15]|uniref:Uncharacterized protein n=1 Tax=Agrobacterium albertimagni AOL15 TaxID=1156935 RepID=K2Q8L0_9HYPH|nr:hypothetical protein [Agrobacterium albertimagni]EKF61545.1 hypothetical protein QWE_00035 [Agrobacterium albertimagni AOL15]
MSKDRDHLELLQYLVAPEPDPVVMQAVISQSRENFVNRRPSLAGEVSSPSLLMRRFAVWLLPVGVATFAGALMVTAYLLQPGPGTDRSRDVIAEVPAPASPDPTELSRGNDVPRGQTPADTSRRLGAQSLPSAGQRPIGALPQIVSRFEGDGVVIGTRRDATGLEIYLPELSGEETIDVQGLMPGEDAEILGAFALPASNLVAIRFGAGDVRFWRIYHRVDGKYGRDPERSKLVSDAQDRAEVERRLGNVGR